MNIEKALRTYLKGAGPRVKEKDFLEYSAGQGNAIFNVLFKLANEELDTMTDQKTLDRLVEVLKLGEIILNTQEDINRKIIDRKLKHLEEKLDRILSEGKKKFENLRKIQSELNKVRRELEVLTEQNEKKDSKQYDFMNFLIEEEKNIAYLEYALKKMPSLANVRNKDEVPIFRTLVNSYLTSILEERVEDELYYENLMTLLLSQNSFQLPEKEKRKVLEDIYAFMNKITMDKRSAKKYKEHTKNLADLVEKIKGRDISSKEVEEIAKKYDIHIHFSDALLDSLRLVKEKREGEMTTREKVEDYCVTMDGEDAVEIDDALSCRKLENGNYLLGVHIASVLGYFPYESEIVQEAIKRNQSIYLPYVYQTTKGDFHRMIPIFPYDFSAEEGSLKEGENRLTRSYYFEITKDGTIASERFPKTITKCNKKLTYEEANAHLESEEQTPLTETLRNLQEVSFILEKKYQASDLYEKVKEASDDLSELRVKKVGAENIVYQCMLLTGTEVANFFHQNSYPCLYRVHEVNEENEKKLQTMIDGLTSTYGGNQFRELYQLLSGIYPKGWYAKEGRHVGLDLEHYCHCTSVLRRAADIIVEHALEVCYDREPSLEDLQKLEAEISLKEKEINFRKTPIEYFVKEYKRKCRNKKYL